MNDLATVFAAITAIGTLAVPVVVAVMANRFNDQVKRWEANQFMNLCFNIFGGMGTDAKLRTGFNHRQKAMGPQWNSTWETMFTHETEREQVDRDNVRRAYDKLIDAFADDIELTSANR